MESDTASVIGRTLAPLGAPGVWTPTDVKTWLNTILDGMSEYNDEWNLKLLQSMFCASATGEELTAAVQRVAKRLQIKDAAILAMRVDAPRPVPPNSLINAPPYMVTQPVDFQVSFNAQQLPGRTSNSSTVGNTGVNQIVLNTGNFTTVMFPWLGWNEMRTYVDWPVNRPYNMVGYDDGSGNGPGLLTQLPLGQDSQYAYYAESLFGGQGLGYCLPAFIMPPKLGGALIDMWSKGMAQSAANTAYAMVGVVTTTGTSNSPESSNVALLRQTGYFNGFPSSYNGGYGGYNFGPYTGNLNAAKLQWTVASGTVYQQIPQWVPGNGYLFNPGALKPFVPNTVTGTASLMSAIKIAAPPEMQMQTGMILSEYYSQGRIYQFNFQCSVTTNGPGTNANGKLYLGLVPDALQNNYSPATLRQNAGKHYAQMGLLETQDENGNTRGGGRMLLGSMALQTLKSLWLEVDAGIGDAAQHFVTVNDVIGATGVANYHLSCVGVDPFTGYTNHLSSALAAPTVQMSTTTAVAFPNGPIMVPNPTFNGAGGAPVTAASNPEAVNFASASGGPPPAPVTVIPPTANSLTAYWGWDASSSAQGVATQSFALNEPVGLPMGFGPSACGIAIGGASTEIWGPNTTGVVGTLEKQGDWATGMQPPYVFNQLIRQDVFNWQGQIYNSTQGSWTTVSSEPTADPYQQTPIPANCTFDRIGGCPAMGYWMSYNTKSTATYAQMTTVPSTEVLVGPLSSNLYSHRPFSGDCINSNSAIIFKEIPIANDACPPKYDIQVSYGFGCSEANNVGMGHHVWLRGTMDGGIEQMCQPFSLGRFAGSAVMSGSGFPSPFPQDVVAAGFGVCPQINTTLGNMPAPDLVAQSLGTGGDIVAAGLFEQYRVSIQVPSYPTSTTNEPKFNEASREQWSYVGTALFINGKRDAITQVQVKTILPHYNRDGYSGPAYVSRTEGLYQGQQYTATMQVNYQVDANSATAAVVAPGGAMLTNPPVVNEAICRLYHMMFCDPQMEFFKLVMRDSAFDLTVWELFTAKGARDFFAKVLQQERQAMSNPHFRAAIEAALRQVAGGAPSAAEGVAAAGDLALSSHSEDMIHSIAQNAAGEIAREQGAEAGEQAAMQHLREQLCDPASELHRRVKAFAEDVAEKYIEVERRRDDAARQRARDEVGASGEPALSRGRRKETYYAGDDDECDAMGGVVTGGYGASGGPVPTYAAGGPVPTDAAGIVAIGDPLKAESWRLRRGAMAKEDYTDHNVLKNPIMKNKRRLFENDKNWRAVIKAIDEAGYALTPIPVARWVAGSLQALQRGGTYPKELTDIYSFSLDGKPVTVQPLQLLSGFYEFHNVFEGTIKAAFDAASKDADAIRKAKLAGKQWELESEGRGLYYEKDRLTEHGLGKSGLQRKIAFVNPYDYVVYLLHAKDSPASFGNSVAIPASVLSKLHAYTMPRKDGKTRRMSLEKYVERKCKELLYKQIKDANGDVVKDAQGRPILYRTVITVQQLVSFALTLMTSPEDPRVQIATIGVRMVAPRERQKGGFMSNKTLLAQLGQAGIQRVSDVHKEIAAALQDQVPYDQVKFIYAPAAHAAGAQAPAPAGQVPVQVKPVIVDEALKGGAVESPVNADDDDESAPPPAVKAAEVDVAQGIAKQPVERGVAGLKEAPAAPAWLNVK